MSSCYPSIPVLPVLGAAISAPSSPSSGNKSTFGVGTRITFYNVTGITSTKPTQIDNPQGANSVTLSNRVGIEIYNNGPNEVEVSQATQPWVYGDGTARKIPVGGVWFLAIGPASVLGTLYVMASAGTTGVLHITETGA